jgi:omega-6 fatty acid desaturase (delta-12 desaturase)
MKKPNLYQTLAQYAKPDLRKTILQIIETFLPYFALWGLMIFTVLNGYSYWLTLGISVFAAAWHIRIFILFHDCTHGSFFKSQRANRIMGYITGILTFTPFEQWRRSHAVHHATVADLDRRGVGDVWMLTVSEYLSASWFKRLAYRIYRNPFVMFGLGPTAVFVFGHRLPHKGAKKPERFSVHITNLAILAILALVTVTIGIKTYLLILTPVMILAGAGGVWLFYVQHQFEGVYWARHENWNPLQAAIDGSSYYKLPKVLQWITGSIGLHHIHHIQPRIPNYNLQECQDEVPELQEVEPLTIRKSLSALWLNLWDEKNKILVSFRSLRAVARV